MDSVTASTTPPTHPALPEEEDATARGTAKVSQDEAPADDAVLIPAGPTKRRSLAARMMAIADIFEALTAADRPYKKAKPLSVAMRIMGFMKKDNHIDPVLFELFVDSGVYSDYAERYLNADQIDEVDHDAVLGRTPKAD